MDTLQLYESSPLFEASKGEGSKTCAAELTEKLLYELDPAHELSFDLSRYLNNSSANINVLSSDSTLASQQQIQGVKSEVPSPVNTDYVTLGQVTTTSNTYPTAACMPEFEQLGSGSEDSQTVWENTSTLKPEDLVYTDGSSSNLTTLTQVTSPTVSSSSPVGSPGPRRPSSGKGSRKRGVEKGTEEYVEKRARNNIAVRKSRAKAKEKQRQTETRVSGLVGDNERLQKKVDLLTKELNVLKGLFINVGAALPSNFAKLLES